MYLRLIFLTLVYLFLGHHRIKCQDDLSDFLLAHPDDAKKLTGDYVTPLAKGFGYAANNGWYNTAKPHSMGFDLTVTATAAFVPTKAQFTQFIKSEDKD